ncbi:MAG: AAA family ATPase [Candidatus Helarchaeota archaeon]
MFQSIEIQGFRGISKLKINDFKRFNLFIGENNCGKTTILESLFILTNPTNSFLPTKTNIFRKFSIFDEISLEVLFHNLNIENPINLFAELYGVDMKCRKLEIYPKYEVGVRLEEDKTNEIEPLYEEYFQSGSTQKITGLTFKTYFIDKSNIEKKYITELSFNKGLGKEPEITQTKPLDYREKLFARFLFPGIYYSKQTTELFGNTLVEKRKKNILRVLRKIEPLLKDITIGPGNVIYCDIGREKMLPINVMGAGFLKIFSIILNIENTKNGIIYIDEIENGLYPKSQEILWKSIFNSAKEFNVQIFSTTHSLDCIKAYISTFSKFKKEDELRVFRIERKGEEIKVKKFDDEEVKIALESEWDIR